MSTLHETLLKRLQKLLRDRSAQPLMPLFISIVAVLTTVGVVAFLMPLLMRDEFLRSDTVPRAEDVLLQEVSRAYDRGMVTNLDAVRRIKEILTVEYPALTDVELSAVLKKWLLSILREPDSTASEQVKPRYEFVNTLFEQEESERPFSILPDKAQVVATKLKDSIEKGNEGKDEALELLVELATSLGSKVKAQEDEVRSTRKLSIYSTAFGAAGVFLFLISVPVPRVIRWLRGKKTLSS